MLTIDFDKSLGLLAQIINERLGSHILASGVVLRDASGRLCFISALEINKADADAASVALREILTSYATSDQVLFGPNDPGAQRVLRDPGKLSVTINNMSCRIVDRRIVGAGWLTEPASKPALPPRIVFASLKGGVGRSTALALTAADLAARGQNVLAIDLDLEAPGLSDLLLSDGRRPDYGVIDYLVEAGVGEVSDNDLQMFVALSSLTSGVSGRLDVLPALGTTSEKYPQNILPKISRAMIENVTFDGDIESLGTQLCKMIERFVSLQSYDVVLIDSRAGLAELTASTVLGLGARVLLFGTAQQQTLTGYRAMFSGLKLLAERDLAGERSADWRLMLKPVLSKASLEPASSEFFASGFYELFSEYLYDSDVVEETSSFAINFAADDHGAPHAPLIIPFNPSFADFDPFRNQDHLAKPFYEQTFRPFFNGLDDLIEEVRHVSSSAS